MATYTQTRTEFTTGNYYDLTAVNGSSQTVEAVVAASFPSYPFTTSANGADLVFDFGAVTLTAGEQTTLANAIAAYTPVAVGTGMADTTTTGLVGESISFTAAPGGTGSTMGGAGGNINLTAGAGGPGATTSVSGGSVNITGGVGGDTGTFGAGGGVNLTAGAAGGSTGTGGQITISAGVGGASGAGGIISFKTAATNTLAERMRITKDGYVQVGDFTQAPSNPFNVGSMNAFSVNSSGNLVKLNNVTYSWPSMQGTSGQVLENNGSGTLSWATKGSVTGTGSMNQLAYWTSSSAISYDSDLYWDSSMNRLGIGLTMPSAALQVVNSGDQMRLGQSSTAYSNFVVASNGGLTLTTVASSDPGGVTVTVGNASTGAAGSIAMTAGNSSSMSTGGNVTLTAGNSGMSNAGGAVTLAAGTGGSSSGTGGALNLKAGAGGTSGVGGAIIFQVAATTSLAEAARITKDSYLGLGTTAPASRLEIETTTTDGQAALLIDQNDTDQPVIKFEGQSSANATDTISTNVVPGTIQGWLQININGTKRWLPFYSDPS